MHFDLYQLTVFSSIIWPIHRIFYLVMKFGIHVCLFNRCSFSCLGLIFTCQTYYNPGWLFLVCWANLVAPSCLLWLLAVLLNVHDMKCLDLLEYHYVGYIDLTTIALCGACYSSSCIWYKMYDSDWLSLRTILT